MGILGSVVLETETVYLNKEVVYGQFDKKVSRYSRIEDEGHDYMRYFEQFCDDLKGVIIEDIDRVDVGTDYGRVIAKNDAVEVVVSEIDDYMAISVKPSFDLSRRNGSNYASELNRVARDLFGNLFQFFEGEVFANAA